MDHAGFAIVHVQSPCTTYNDTYEIIKGNPKKGIEPTIWDIPVDHDPSDRKAAYDVIHAGGLPVGVIYRDTGRQSLDQRLEQVHAKVAPKGSPTAYRLFSVLAGVPDA